MVRIVLALAAAAALIGCSAEPVPASTRAPGSLSPGQEASARTLGIETPNSVKQAPGMYTGDINLAKDGVAGEQKRIEAENAAVRAMSGAPH
jgi:hypothetical protein